MCRDQRTSIYLDDNTSINSVPVENSLRTHIFAGYFDDVVYLIYFKNHDCACQKSFAIRTDGVSFQIILACFALAAILEH